MSSIGHKPGPPYPDRVEVIVEIPKDSRNKYELDDETGAVWLDRTLFTATRYPANYGFIPQSLAGDGDPLDVLVLMDEPVFPGCHIWARPIAVLEMLRRILDQERTISAAQFDLDRLSFWKNFRELDALEYGRQVVQQTRAFDN